MDPDDFDSVYDEFNRVCDEYDSDMEVIGTRTFGTDDSEVGYDDVDN